MSKTENEFRAQFEEKFETPHGVFWSAEHGRYVTHQAHVACVQHQGRWEGWQASRAAVVVELPDRDVEQCDYSLGFNSCLKQSRSAIEAQGLKVKP